MVYVMLTLVGIDPHNLIKGLANYGLVVCEIRIKSLVRLAESGDLPSLRCYNVATLKYQFAQVLESVIGIELGQSTFHLPGLQFSDVTLHTFVLLFVFPVLISFVD